MTVTPLLDLRARQNAYLAQLQVLEPGRPIAVQHHEKDSWHVCAGPCAKRPLWTRSMLRNEVVWDFDEPTYAANARFARVLHGCLREADVPHFVFSTGSRGVHVLLYVKMKPDTTDAEARGVREAVWEHFLEVSALKGVAKVDRSVVGWTSRRMLHAWADTRKAPYAYTERPTSFQPTDIGPLPPRPTLWDPSWIPEVAARRAKKHVHHDADADANMMLQSHAVDLYDWEHYPFIKDLMTPATDHDDALIACVLLAKTTGRSEDECSAFVAAKWAPTGPCSSRSHEPGSFELAGRVRNIYRSKWLFSPAKAYKLLRAMGKEPDRIVWKLLFRRLPLELRPGEARRAKDCGNIEWARCVSCGRAVPLEMHCRAYAVCADCQQHHYIVAAKRYRDEIQGRLDLGMELYVFEVPIQATRWQEAMVEEIRVRKTIEMPDLEMLRTVLPDKVVYSMFAPFSVDGEQATQTVRTFGEWLRHVVPLRSWRVVFADEPDVERAIGEWEDTARRGHLFQSFGWHRGDLLEERTFKVKKRGPVMCPYCGGRLFANPFADYGADRPRDTRLFRSAGIGPPR